MRYGTVVMTLATLVVSTPAVAQSVEAFYKGKTVYLTIGSDPASAGDSYNRLISRHIGKHIPGAPTITVQNVPGAGGLVHLNNMYNVVAKDGTVIGLTRESTPFEPLFTGKESQAKFDPLKFNWLGAPNRFPAVAIAWHTAPVKKAEDLYTHELLIGGIGLTGSTNDAYVLRNILGFKYRVIMGYPGPAAVDLAMERGELQGRASAGWEGLNSRNAEWLREKKVNILYQMGLEKNPNIPPEVPLLLDFAKTPQDRALLELKFASNSLGFPYMLPPGTPTDRVAAIRAAFVATLNDPELRQDAKKQILTIAPVRAEEIEAILKKSYSASPEMLARLAEASKPPADAEPARPK
jgi:hypothetical protein